MEKANIPTQNTKNIIRKYTKLYETWFSLNRRSVRKTAAQKEKTDDLNETLGNLFDAAVQDAIHKIEIEEDRLFLLAQRQKNRIGAVGAMDSQFVEKMVKKVNRKDTELRRIATEGQKAQLVRKKCNYNHLIVR